MTESEKLLSEIHGDTKAIRQCLQDHINNPVIHQVPPCEHQVGLSKKLWAIGLAAFSALLGVVWQQFKP